MDSLLYLKLSDNLLTSIDQFPWNELVYLDLSSNLITGDISSFICNATSLSVINLSNNKFIGTLPQCLANFSYLHGTLPNIFPMCKDPFNLGLDALNLNGNHLEGQLPKSLSSCIELENLNLGNNQIEDTFPHWLQHLPDLKILVLGVNKFYGPVVSSEKRHLFPNLIVFDISCNNFSGPLPKDYLKKFQAMKSVVQAEGKSNLDYITTYGGDDMYADLVMSEYNNTVIATIKRVSTTFVKIPTNFVNIDLSNNKFEGEIPNVIGELHGLKGLNLSHNRLTGHIPRSMGNLTSLESLDLSSSMLTGGIPIELTNLNFLEVLNLSQNHLVGEIPQGKQFNTFSNDSYEGNMGLCGLPLSMQCNKEDPEQQSPSSPTFEVEEIFWIWLEASGNRIWMWNGAGNGPGMLCVVYRKASVACEHGWR